MWMNAAKLNVPKMKYVLYAIVDRPGGTAHASAKLNSLQCAPDSAAAISSLSRRPAHQFIAVETDTALARTRMGKISAGYVQDTGPIVMAKLQTKRYEQTMTPFVIES